VSAREVAATSSDPEVSEDPEVSDPEVSGDPEGPEVSADPEVLEDPEGSKGSVPVAGGVRRPRGSGPSTARPLLPVSTMPHPDLPPGPDVRIDEHVFESRVRCRDGEDRSESAQRWCSGAHHATERSTNIEGLRTR
jgi:hypothetical protein